MLVVWVLDTSASMNQRAHGGLTLLDCAKSAIEHFLKMRARDQASRQDVCMLVTCEEGAGGLLLDKFPFTNLVRALKAATATHLSTLGNALKRALDRLNMQRLASGVDTFGLGRNPCMMEQAHLIVLTDGTELTNTQGVVDTFSMPMHGTPGSELVKEPFRWDQRVFCTVMQLPGTVIGSGPPAGAGSEERALRHAECSLAIMCEITGGRCVAVTGMRALLQNMESLVARMAPAVALNFVHAGRVAENLVVPSNTHLRRRLLFTRQLAGFTAGVWPIPEVFNVGASTDKLPPRDAHPTLYFSLAEAEVPVFPSGFPVDKYDVEQCGLNALLLQTHSSNACWQVSPPLLDRKGELKKGEPCGYLKLNTTTNCVSLYLLPYNYPALLHLVNQLLKLPPAAKLTPPRTWLVDMERYCNSLPACYLAPLKTSLRRLNIAPRCVPTLPEGGLAFAAANYLKRVKQQARAELEMQMGEEAHALGLAAAAHLPHSCAGGVGANTGADADACGAASTTSLNSVGAAAWGLGDAWRMSTAAPGSAAADTVDKPQVASLIRNAFDVPRSELLSKMGLLSSRLLAASWRHSRSSWRLPAGGSAVAAAAASAEAEARAVLEQATHCVPVALMGDYHEVLRRRCEPRDPYLDDEERARSERPSFGNPFRRWSDDNRFVADEAGEVDGEVDGERRAGSPVRKKRRRSMSPSPDRQRSPSGMHGDGEGALEGPEGEQGGARDGRAAHSPSRREGAAADVTLQVTESTGPETTSRAPHKVEKSGKAPATVAKVGPSSTQGKPRSATKHGNCDEVVEVDTPSTPTLTETPQDSTSAEIGETSDRGGLEGRAGERDVSSSLGKRAGRDAGAAVRRDNCERLLRVVRALRHPNTTSEQLFHLLNAQDFPVNKKNFAQQLVIQARRYKRDDMVAFLQSYVTRKEST